MKIMGILNVTPDSFSDGNKYNSEKLILEQVAKMIREGATIIDVGGESTRPGATLVSASEEIKRVKNVVQLIKNHFDVEISVDTYKPEVATECLKIGVDYINDVHGSYNNLNMFKIISEYKCKYILMHCSEDFKENGLLAKAAIDKILSDIKLALESLEKVGVEKEKIIIDPGIGFHKKAEQSLSIIANLDYLKEKSGYEVLLGASRKSSLAKISGIEEASKRDIPTAITSIYALLGNVDYVRVHNVEANRQAIESFGAIYEYRN